MSDDRKQEATPQAPEHDDHHSYACDHWHQWHSYDNPAAPTWAAWPLGHRHQFGIRTLVLVDHARPCPPPEV